MGAVVQLNSHIWDILYFGLTKVFEKVLIVLYKIQEVIITTLIITCIGSYYRILIIGNTTKTLHYRETIENRHNETICHKKMGIIFEKSKCKLAQKGA